MVRVSETCVGRGNPARNPAIAGPSIMPPEAEVLLSKLPEDIRYALRVFAVLHSSPPAWRAIGLGLGVLCSASRS